MSHNKKGAKKNLDQELDILRDLIERENEMLRKMLNSLDALEKKMKHPLKKEKRPCRGKKE
jgi:hypothetical protein